MRVKVSGRKVKISAISSLHYIKLAFRALLFLAVAAAYFLSRYKGSPIYGSMEKSTPLLTFVWIVFAVEMVLRFFPSKLESMGCQKQFKRNYIPKSDADRTARKHEAGGGLVSVILFWVSLNGIIGALYIKGIIDEGALLLIALFYSVCDMICILFFCPFQTWMMKNKCCGSCRIYNWDYAMMFTPFIFIDNPYARSLLFLSLLLLAKWELAYYFHPERFSEKTNKSLECCECREKLCQHKKQLQSFLRELDGKINMQELEVKGKKHN